MEKTNTSSPPSSQDVDLEKDMPFDAAKLHTLTIEKIAKNSINVLIVSLTITTLAAFVAMAVIPNPLVMIVLAVSVTALAILLSIKILSHAYSHMPKSIQSTLDVARAVGTEVLSLIACVPLFPFKVSRTDPKAKVETDKPPILFIHGFLHNSSFAVYYKYRLEEARKEMEENGQEVKYGPIFSLDLGSPCHSFEEYLEMIERKTLEIQKLTGRKDIILIGHSMGGDLSTLFAQHHKQEIQVTHVVTIGSPLRGTKAAYLGLFSKAAKQMRPVSDAKPSLLSKLKQHVLSNDRGTRYCHIGSTNDLIVPGGSWIDDNPRAKNLRIDDAGHVGMIFSDRVFNYFLNFLQN